MFCELIKMFPCLPRTYEYESSDSSDDDFDEDPCGWTMNIDYHYTGEFSMAAVHANEIMEDFSQFEDGHEAYFFGLYDGHRGTEASEYLSTHLFPNLLRGFNQRPTMDAMRLAVSETVEGFMNVVRRDYIQRPMLGRVGSSCLAGYVYRGRILYLTNLGDSRAIIGSVNEPDKITAEQLTTDCNGRNGVIANLLHDDQHIVSWQNIGTWFVKGISKLSKSIRNVFLKKRRPLSHVDLSKFDKVLEPFRRPVISSTPETLQRMLRDEDKFLIIASHGLWEILSNEEAVNLVHSTSRWGSARRLIQEALEKVAKKKNISYESLKSINNRRAFHDDITVIVVFLDRPNATCFPSQTSMRGFQHANRQSDFANFNWQLNQLY